MTTIRTIVADALMELSLIDPGEPLDAAEGDYALRVLNRMLDKWSTEPNSVFSTNRTIFSFVAGQQDYTLGIGANWVMARPAQISMVSVIPSGSTQQEIPCNMIGVEEWRDITVKSTPSTFATSVWIRGSEPLEILSFWPVPKASGAKAVIYSGVLLGPYASLNDDLGLPEGYEEAIVTNLAMTLSGPFKAQPAATLAARAMSAKNNLYRMNPTNWDICGDTTPLSIKTFGYVVDRS